jgi:hypothetical protein
VLLLLSGATRYRRSASVGDFIVPKAWAPAASLTLAPRRWAMDNGAFSGFDAGAFVRMLEEFARVPGCLFCTAPDVVGDAASTLKLWPFWARLIRGLGFPPALVAQDGLAADRVPWDHLGALFIGGTTAYKTSPDVAALVAYAKARGIWVHVGRLNGRIRYRFARTIGADSFDGTGFSRWSDKRIPKIQQWDRLVEAQPALEW